MSLEFLISLFLLITVRTITFPTNATTKIIDIVMVKNVHMVLSSIFDEWYAKLQLSPAKAFREKLFHNPGFDISLTASLIISAYK